MTKYFVIGDIHGCGLQLARLLEERYLMHGRRVIFLGDYVDVGPDSRSVLEQLISFEARHGDVVFLEGNHENALKLYLEQGDFGRYAECGGIATIRSFCGEVRGDVHEAFSKAICPVQVDFLSRLKTHLETSNFLFSHCGYSITHPENRSREMMVLASHQDLFKGAGTLDKVAVCGHYFQRTQRPFISESVICLDTGCGVLQGPLTAIELPERRLIQVSTNLALTAD